MRITRSSSIVRFGILSFMPGLCIGLLIFATSAFAQSAPESPTQQQPAPVSGDPDTYSLKVTTRNVVLDVVVTDKKGMPVTGLTRDDFKVFEDKTPQSINSFEQTPATVAPSAILPVNSTAELDKIEPDAPVSILVIDELTTRFEDLAFARYSLKKYLKAQGDTLEQPTMLISANYRNIAVLRDYTTSRKEIIDALEHHLADYAALTRAQNNSWTPDQINATFGSLLGVAEATAGHRGHKNMIWIGRGFPLINTATLLPSMQEAFDGQLAVCSRLLRDSRITLYAVDPAGIRTEPPAHDSTGFLTEDPFGGQVDFDTIAVSTGGKALHGRNDVDNMIEESVRDGESFYTLAYRPAIASTDPKTFRRIKVVMKDPALHASTREGYFVVAAPVAPVKEANGKFSSRLLFDMNVAANSLLVYDGVPVTVTRDATTPDRFNLHLKAADLPLQPDASNKPSAELTILVASFSKRGKLLEHNAKIFTVRMTSSHPSAGPDTRSVSIPVSISTRTPVARLRFIVRANATGNVGAENFFLVDSKALASSTR